MSLDLRTTERARCSTHMSKYRSWRAENSSAYETLKAWVYYRHACRLEHRYRTVPRLVAIPCEDQDVHSGWGAFELSNDDCENETFYNEWQDTNYISGSNFCYGY